mgnify:CR=1 FL=1
MALKFRRHAETNFLPAALYMYNSPTHLRLQAKSGWVVFELTGKERGEVKARISIHVKGHAAISPARAPFGSIEMYSRISHAALLNFFRFVEAGLRQNGVKQLEIKHWPASYQPFQAKQVQQVLAHQLHFAVTEEVSSVIPVGASTLRMRMKPSERQKASKSEKLFSFSCCAPGEYKTMYDFIQACRTERKQSLSLSWKEMRQTISKFPDRFVFFKLANATGVAAAAIVIRVSDKIWYTFYYAHAAKYNKVSPVVHLLECIYARAASEKVKLIDLGTSMLQNKINKPLLHFKESIGAVTGPKFTFRKSYE